MSQPSSQESVGIPEVCSQGSFEAIWDSLKRTFSNPEKMMEGVLKETPLVIEYKDEGEPDNLRFEYEERALQSVYSGYDHDAQLQLDTDALMTRSDAQNGHHPLTNGSIQSLPPSLIPSGPVRPVHLQSILGNTNYPGVYQFSISFEPNTGPITKATPWVYQAEHQKLFVKMQCVCPILFKISGSPPPDSIVRGVLMYKRPEHYKEIVIRCPNHRNMCKDGHPFQDHVMRCENAQTVYETCPSTGRPSLVIPLRAINVVAGEGYFKELFKFTCFNSCVGGMNRRPTNLLFRLESRGHVLGRAVVEVRICASPGRDCNEKESVGQKNTKEDRRSSVEPSTTTGDVIPSVPLTSPQSPSVSPTSSFPNRPSVLMFSNTKNDASCVIQEPPRIPSMHIVQKKRPYAAKNVVVGNIKRTCIRDSGDNEVFSLEIRGREKYEMLLKIKEGLDLLDGVRPLQRGEQRFVSNESGGSPPEYTKITPRAAPPVQIKQEGDDNSQCNGQLDTSPPSSQDTADLSQLSRTSSNASNTSSQSYSGNSACAKERFMAWQVTLKRTLSLDKNVRTRCVP